MNVLSCGLLWAKSIKHFGDYGRHFHLATYAKILAACARVCHRRWRNRKIVPYHGDSPNSRISARLWSPSPIMAPAFIWKELYRKITNRKKMCKYLFI